MAIIPMIVDVAQDSQLKTAHRFEGLLVSVDNVLKKTTSGVGVFGASLILAATDLSARISPDQVSDANMAKKGLAYVPAIGLIYGGALLGLFAFRLDEFTLQGNLGRLQERHAHAGQ